MIHELKIESKYFNDILKGIKKFEIRKNDRNYQVGDYLILKEWNGSNYTKTSIRVVVIYITDYMQKPDYVVLGFEPVTRATYAGV